MQLIKIISFVMELIKGSRWRKASKCKSLIKRLRKRLLFQKRRRSAITRQLRADVAQLLRDGQYKVALLKVAQLLKDQCALSAYDQLEYFCDCIYTNCGHIGRYSNKLSADMQEAVSSLVFAASRCGELPELHLLRKLFRRQFGPDFERKNVELLPGNAVNSQIKHNLCLNSVTNDEQIQLLNEIAKELHSHDDYTGLEQQGVSREDSCGGDEKRRTSFSWVKKITGPERHGAFPENYVNTTTSNHAQQVHLKEVSSSSSRYENEGSQPSHIHPKLPDYDDVVAKFKILKNDYLQNNSNIKLHTWLR